LSNFLPIPTDTPAHDERMGWTGDVNVFARTAVYNSQAFLAKWLQDLRDCQASNGAYPSVAPTITNSFDGGLGNTGWADAGVNFPWALWQAYGAVGEWMYRTLAGVSAAEPGYRKALIAATPGDGINSCDFSLLMPYGMVTSRGRGTVEDGLTLDVTLPANTTATVRLPPCCGSNCAVESYNRRGSRNAGSP
jgi:hypothetical protein